MIYLFFIFKDFIYLILERGAGKERGRETSMCGCFLLAPYWGPGLQSRHVPWLGIKLVTLWFAGPCSIHWAIPTRANYIFIIIIILPTFLFYSIFKVLCSPLKLGEFSFLHPPLIQMLTILFIIFQWIPLRLYSWHQ